MNLQSVVSDVKTRVDSLTTQGQELAKVLPGTFKQANEILVSGVQTLVKKETSSAKGIFEAAKAGFEKAKTDGLKAVVADPVSYLPEKKQFVSAFNDTVEVVTKTGDDLYQTFLSSLKPAPKKQAHAHHAHAPAKKAATKKRAVKKASAKHAAE
jgi:hypothetical protein